MINHYRNFQELFNKRDSSIYSDSNTTSYSHPPKNVVNWNKNHIATLHEILSRIILMMDESGAIKYSTKPNAGHGPYQTLETLLPFILYPLKDDFANEIIRMATYVLEEADTVDGGYKPFPEYPYWEFSAVDSTAYAIHIFALLRDYLYIQKKVIPDNEYHANRVNLAIKKAIAFIGRNVNNDDGWGFVKNESLGLVSRTYSTSLVINALSHCLDDDFPKEMSQKALIGRGVKYLLNQQIQSGDDQGGWFFSQEDTRVHPNISSVVVFSLTRTYKYDRDRRVEHATEQGIRYITKFWTIEDIAEKVKYPTSSGNNKIAFHEFIHPHQMILPAALLSGEVGFNDNRIQNVAIEILDNYKQKIEHFEKEPLDPDSSLNAWDLAETAFTLSTYYSVCSVVEHSSVLFANANMHYHIIQDTFKQLTIALSELGKTKKKMHWYKFWLIFLGFFSILGTSLSIYVTLNPDFADLLNKQYKQVIGAILSLVIIPFAVNLLYDIAKNYFSKNKIDRL